MKVQFLKINIVSLMFLGLFEFSAVAAMPVQNPSNVMENDVQSTPSQAASCTVPAGLSEECTRALTTDCQQISQCNGDADCMTNRTRVDISACQEAASAKPQRQQFVEIDDKQSLQSPTSPKAEPKTQPRSPSSHAISSATRTSGVGDPNPDVRSCLRALSAAQSACNVSQAASFDNQLSGGTNGFGGANLATAGVQNVNNIVLNCSNSQSICASTCGDSWSS